MRRVLRYCLGKINRKSKKIVLTEAATGNSDSNYKRNILLTDLTQKRCYYSIAI